MTLKNKPLKPYMVSGPDPSEGAVLVFAHTVRKAKVIGYQDCNGWGIEWLDLRCRLIAGDDYIRTLGDKEKLANGVPHGVDDPESCKDCYQWGSRLNNGTCERCIGSSYYED